ncbi:hypothetical protein [Agromyces sp. S2-1-8]|jgi:hypothetical protein|uniref:hypothetical protein n=1 Tax=unclassified Agromyces TaxID=2639701 RepID=UPI001E39F989|nr:hypothetical protein [Agromyces sp. S2-1-8]MCD5344858.1 hypothetical protein [Agromyces sp. S2-1-8]
MTSPEPAPGTPAPGYGSAGHAPAQRKPPADSRRSEPVGVVALVFGVFIVVLDFVMIFVTASIIRSADFAAYSTVSLVSAAVMVVLALAAISVGVVAFVRGGATRVYGAIGATIGAMALIQQFGSLIYGLIVGA